MRGFSYVGSSGQSAALPARRNHLQKDGREFIASMLEELGCETLTARSATDALGQLARDEGIDMLFADVNMPGLSGRELAERARDFRPQLRVLLVSGLESDGRGFPLLRKPFSQSDLRRVLAETTGLCED
jgi:two-component system, cell cycle response regulator CpdR